MWKGQQRCNLSQIEHCILNEPFEEGRDDNQTERDHEGDLLQSQSDEPGDQSNKRVSNSINLSSSDQLDSES